MDKRPGNEHSGGYLGNRQKPIYGSNENKTNNNWYWLDDGVTNIKGRGSNVSSIKIDLTNIKIKRKVKGQNLSLAGDVLW